MDREHMIRETRRYLGYGSQAADERTEELIGECLDELLTIASPRSVSLEFSLRLPEGGDMVITDAFAVKSRHLRKNLTDCEGIVFFAATLGAEVDKRIQRQERIRMSRAVILQAGAAALIEEYCDEINESLKRDYEKKGWYMRPRFSPGYGDFPLECQKGVLGALEAGKRIGITLTDSLLMVPSKSVTAVIGLSRRPLACVVQGCEACGKTDCAYRRC